MSAFSEGARLTGFVALLQHKTIRSVIAGAWLLVGLPHATGLDIMVSHHRLAHAPGSLGSALVAIIAWQVTVGAMMLPSCLPAIAYGTRNTLLSRRHLAAFEFVLAYLSVWTVFAVAAIAAEATLHWLAPDKSQFWCGDDRAVAADAALGQLARQTGWLVPHHRAPLLPILATAIIWQFTPAKRATLRRCGNGPVLPAYGWNADAACLGFGLRHGGSCVGSCWALMLIMFATGTGNAALVAMAVLAIFVWAEKSQMLNRFSTLSRAMIQNLLRGRLAMELSR